MALLNTSEATQSQVTLFFYTFSYSEKHKIISKNLLKGPSQRRKPPLRLVIWKASMHVSYSRNFKSFRNITHCSQNLSLIMNHHGWKYSLKWWSLLPHLKSQVECSCFCHALEQWINIILLETECPTCQIARTSLPAWHGIYSHWMNHKHALFPY